MKKLLLALPLFASCTESATLTEPICQTHTAPFAHTRCATTDTDGLKLYWQNKDNTPFYTADKLINEHGEFAFVMNAGMYDREFAPIGYTVMNGKLVKELNQNEGDGNFHLMPNGVFWWNEQGAFVDSTLAFTGKLAQGVTPHYATQSGPMLVIDGQIHPKFDPKSTSLKLRNGVGTECTDQRTHFVISDTPVNFYEFADLFKRGLGCQNALFLDGGSASALYAKNLNRHDKLNMAVMIGLQR